MTDSRMQGKAAERTLRRLMRAAVYGSTISLVAGLLVWILDHGSRHAASLLSGGLIALMATPALRMAMSAVEAVRLKDRVHLATIAAVAVLLGMAVTLALR